MIEVQNSVPHPRVSEAALFPFDDTSLPFTAGLRLHMAGAKQVGKNPIVVLPSQTGAPDDMRTRFYGTVIPGDDALRMWYLGAGSTHEHGAHRLCHAVSRDGVHWEKPALGLVEYNGSTDNNLVDLQGGADNVSAAPILFDPEDPDPNRRFKVAFECGAYDKRLSVAFSPDGLRWTESVPNPVGSYTEMSGLIRFNGCYYVNGHGGFHFGMSRELITYASYDFEDWTQASCRGFQRDRLPALEIANVATRGVAGEQVHLGAGLWDRGNIILGVYDIWHGPDSGDRKQVRMDLGLLISHNALQYREPMPDFRLVPAYEEQGGPGAFIPQPGMPPITRTTLSHGQGMCNWGEETMLWYEAWGDGGIRLARWPRDRLGYLRAFNPEEFGRPMLPHWADTVRHCISCPLQADAGPARIYVNVDRLGEHSELTVEVLDEQFRPLPGYSGQSCLPLRESGLRQPVRWKDRDTVGGIDGPFRLRVNFGGVRPEDTRLYALYVA